MSDERVTLFDINAEIAQWTKLVKQAKITLD